MFPMKVAGKNYTAVWMKGHLVMAINQPLLPHRFEVTSFKNHRETAEAIRTMIVRGAPAIGVAAAYGLALAARRGCRLSVDATACGCGCLRRTSGTATLAPAFTGGLRAMHNSSSPRPRAACKRRKGHSAPPDRAMAAR